MKEKLNRAGIPTDKPGFFDHPAFLAVEKNDQAFLEEYARFVQWQAYDDLYLQRAEKIIRIVSDELHRGLVLEGRFGGCIDTSMTLARILDLHGIWNYFVRGSLRIDFPPASGHAPFCFWPVDEDDGTDREFGHKWVYAPPFFVVDVTLRLQDYPRPFHNLLPEKVFERTPAITKAVPSDILCPSAIIFGASQGLNPQQTLASIAPKFVQSFASDFPAYLIQEASGLRLKYVPIGIGVSDVPLEGIRSFMVKGRTAFEFYEQEIKPKLATVGND